MGNLDLVFWAVDSAQCFVEGLEVASVSIELCSFSQVESPFVLQLSVLGLHVSTHSPVCFLGSVVIQAGEELCVARALGLEQLLNLCIALVKPVSVLTG